MMFLEKIISGRQTGVDRAALDSAIATELSYGGWCPKGRLAERGEIIPLKYHMQETYNASYSERTILNILHSDATLLLLPINLSFEFFRPLG